MNNNVSTGGSASTATAAAAAVLTIAAVAILAQKRRYQRRNRIVKYQDYTSSEKAKMCQVGFATPNAIPPSLDYIIIGSGMGGLSTASILAQEGKRVLVLEQHDVVGGNTHTFEDGEGYEFDTGLHYIGRKNNVKEMFRYITRDALRWSDMDPAYDVAVVGKDRVLIRGEVDCDDSDSDHRKVIRDLKEMFSKENHMAIDLHFKYVRLAVKLIPLYAVVRMLPSSIQTGLERCFPSYIRLFTHTTQQILDSLTDNIKLKGILSYIYGDFGEVPTRGGFAIHAMLWDHFQSGAMYPVGGPSVIAQSIVPIIKDAGGAVLVRAPVSTLLFDDNQNTVIGVEVKGKRIYAPIVISSIGAPQTFQKLVPPSHRYLVKRQLEGIQHPDIVSDMSLMSLFIGLKTSEDGKKCGGIDIASSLPNQNYWIFPSWDHSANWQEYDNNGNGDDNSDSNDNGIDNDIDNPPVKALKSLPTPAVFISFPSIKDPAYNTRHPNRQVAVVIGPSKFTHVQNHQHERVKHRGSNYTALKESYKESLLKVFLQEFPHLKDAIDFVDLGTAVTNDYYLGTYRGAVYGLAHTPHRFQQTWLRPETPVKGLYLTGQDMMSCGIVGALVGGIRCTISLDKSRLVTVGRLLV